MINSAFLMYLILKANWDKSVPENLNGFLIGAYYAVINSAFGVVTGGAINPARIIGPHLFSGILVSPGNYLSLSGLVFAPCIGKS